jgi:hypothetical protein
MKKLFFLVSFLMVLVMAPMAMADQVSTVGGFGPYQTGRGGELTLAPSADLQWVLNSYVQDVTKNVVAGTTDLPFNFQTFCVEHSENIPRDTTFEASISDHSIYSNKPLTQGAAWLYHQFQIGTLTGYNYSNNTPARYNNDVVDNFNDNDLQQAIWYFMGEETTIDPLNQFGILGSAHGGLTPNEGLYPVAVLNLWYAGHLGQSGYGVQDVLVCVPEPATMLLLGSGLLGLAGYGRKKFFKK